MLRISLVAALALFVVVPWDVYAQNSGQTTRELVAALDKTKYKKKEKANVSIETYIDIKNEAAVRDPVEYGGNYESEDSGCGLSLHVERDGMVVRLTGRHVRLDRTYLAQTTAHGDPALTHGYAFTGHVAQGLTVARDDDLVGNHETSRVENWHCRVSGQARGSGACDLGSGFGRLRSIRS